MPAPQRCFTHDFQDEAVRLAGTSGRPRREIAQDLGIGLCTLRQLIDRRRERRIEQPPHDRQEEMAAELKRLRRENVILRQERDTLQQGKGFFRQSGQSMRFKLIDVAISRPAPVQGSPSQSEQLFCPGKASRRRRCRHAQGSACCRNHRRLGCARGVKVRDTLTLLPFRQFEKSMGAPRLFALGERLRRSNVDAPSGGTLDYMRKDGIDPRE